MILCLGMTPALQRTMVFERLTADAVNRAAEVRESASGKSINVARVLRVLGAEAVAIGFLGGNTGRFMRRDLEALGVAHDFVEVEPRTRTCVTVIDRAAGTSTELVEETPAVAAGAYDELLRRLTGRLPRARMLVLSGSLPPGASDDLYAQCAGMARQAQVPVIVDGRGAPLRLALGQRPLVVKPNRSELAATVGRTLDTDEALREAMRQVGSEGGQWVVVTLGAAGAWLSDGRDFWRVHAPKVEALNPIGSGDAFAAGLAAGITRGQSVPEACQWAAACAGANAMTLVAGVVRAEDVAALLPQVRVERA